MINYDKQNRKIEKFKKERNEAIAAAEKAEEDCQRLYKILDGIMHDTRRLNSEIENACEEISKHISNFDYKQASEEAGNVFYKSGILSSRLAFTDFELNPEAITRQPRYSAGVYKKFDKARHILLRSANRRQINIQLTGPSHNEIDVLPAFEMVPFVLIDNAVKYSPDGQDIKIFVTDNPSTGCRVKVDISSIGPTVESYEISCLINRGFRGNGAKSCKKVSGQGIGLYLANTLVMIENGTLEVSSGKPQFSKEGVNYSKFTVTLKFR